jgi:biotin operon repressor/anti-sigma regulatory factor (Ser/Thr protein kinase)
MKRIRARGEEIRQFILDQVETHPADIAKLAIAKFQISRQAINKHLQRLTAEGCLKESGRTRGRTYQLAPLTQWRRIYEISEALKDDIVWTNDIRPALGALPDNVMNIWQTVFTEMFNNAIEHSGGRHVIVNLRRTAASTDMDVVDDGIGIFAKIRAAFDLPDERHAVLELSKGKLTTDPRNHSGEGIFFSSRMVDFFVIQSGEVFFSHHFGEAEDFILESSTSGKGTVVSMKLSNHSSRTARQIYDQYTSGDDFGFTKTVVPVTLARYGNDALVSRSQAKRVLARVEQFKVVVFDFAGVEAIGQAFADELFRVFPLQHPEIEFHTMNASPEVESMIARARATHI